MYDIFHLVHAVS